MEQEGTEHVEGVAEETYQIVAFCCQYCAYAAADLAGQLRLHYPPAIKVVHLPCTGKLDVLMVLQALEAGADGVMAVGCLPGDCHFLEGNLNAARRMERIQALLAEIGLEPERARMFNLSSAMASAFAASATEMTEQIAALGRSPLRGRSEDQLGHNSGAGGTYVPEGDRPQQGDRQTVAQSGDRPQQVKTRKENE